MIARDPSNCDLHISNNSQDRPYNPIGPRALRATRYRYLLSAVQVLKFYREQLDPPYLLRPVMITVNTSLYFVCKFNQIVIYKICNPSLFLDLQNQDMTKYESIILSNNK